MTSLFLPGAQKSASTTLYRLLEDHAEICVSPRKEPHYFSTDGLYDPARTSYEEREFPGFQGERYGFDASQSYLGVDGVPGRIHETVGEDARFIIILRHPVDRAASTFRHFRAKPGGELVRSIQGLTPPALDGFDLDALLHWEEEHVQRALSTGTIEGRNPSWSAVGFPFRYFYVSAYSVHLARYLALFPREHFLFLTFEEVTRQQEMVSQRVWAFLDVEPHVVTADPVHANKTLAYKEEGIGKAVLAIKERIRPLKRFLPGDVLRRVRSVEEAFLLERREDRFAPEVYEHLTRIFAPDIARTEALTGLDLSTWTVPVADRS